MGWSTYKDGDKFGYELWGDEGIIAHIGGYASRTEADQAGCRANANWQRFGVSAPVPPYSDWDEEDIRAATDALYNVLSGIKRQDNN
jgi:hypothetical protein